MLDLVVFVSSEAERGRIMDNAMTVHTKIGKGTIKGCLCFILIPLFFFLCVIIFTWGVGFQETGVFFSLVQTDPRVYNRHIGNLDNKTPEIFFQSFFPPEIEDFYSNVSYRYKAQIPGSYACEKWLEFSFLNQQQFEEYYQNLKQYGEPQAFPYNGQYEVWIISNTLNLYERSTKHIPTTLSIGEAKIGLILCDHQNQHFVYAALMVSDGGTAAVDDLNYMFEKLNISPSEYAQSQLQKP